MSGETEAVAPEATSEETKPKEPFVVPRLTDDELRAFVNDFLSSRIFTSAHLREPDLLPMVFMPVAFGAFAGVSREELETIGCLWEHYDKALPRSINGQPTFVSFKMLHVADWARARKVIAAEQQRRASIELPPDEPAPGDTPAKEGVVP